MPVEGVDANDNESWISLGKPAQDGTKELEKGAKGVEAKKVSDELLVEGFAANDNKSRVSLGKPGKDVTKESEEGAIGVK